MLFHFACEAMGAAGTRLSLRPLIFGGRNYMQDSGAARHERSEMMRCRTGTHLFRGTNGSRFCEAALHAASRLGHEEASPRLCFCESSVSSCGTMDCFAGARNDRVSRV